MTTMDATTHTPGPWGLRKRHDKGGYTIRPAAPRPGNTNRPCVAYTEHLAVPYDEEEANARLIAAAPAMVEVLRSVAEALDPTLPVTQAARAMNQPDDYYGAIIRQRAAAEAADLLADECRKKDAALVQLWAALEAARGEGE